MQEGPKCLICGQEVQGIGELDVPYHIECVLHLWRLQEKTMSQRRLSQMPGTEFTGRRQASVVHQVRNQRPAALL